jgi:thiosulfate/3-mercaptopyruvate sulfurtransferase
MAANDIDPSKPIVCSCGSGMSATFDFASMQHAGLTNISLYDGSWSEYVRYFIPIT